MNENTEQKDKEMIRELLSMLKSLREQVSNDWDNKKREEYIFNSLLTLNFLSDGSFVKKNKSLISNLKSVYNSSDNSKFNTSILKEYYPDLSGEEVFIIHEPFGSKASPDFLFITPKVVFGIEDKSSKTEKVSFNTGTPGGNKFIMYFDKKGNTVYLISGRQWNWDTQVENEFREFTRDIISYAKTEFEKRFGDRIKNMEYYARPMLVDKNKIKDIVSKDESDVVDILKKSL
jgi:hypothetical protein